MSEEHSNWVEAMAQQTNSDIAAEALRLQKDQGLDKESANVVARRRAAMGMQLRGRLIGVVTQATTREGYKEMSVDEKMETLKEVLRVEATKIRKELTDPIERIINDACNIVDQELLRRIEETLRGDSETDTGREEEAAGGSDKGEGGKDRPPE